MKEILLIMLLLTALPVSAVELSQMTDSDKTAFDQILTPVTKIYNLVKYSSTVIAVIVLLISGIYYMLSGCDPKQRDNAKNMAMYVILGLLVIWAAPFIVSLITS
jgi:type IV secretory pathway VirB2 component (pilin)